MTRKFTDGAEFGDLLFWTSSPTGSSAATDQARSGTYSYKISSNSTVYYSKTISAISEFYLRFGFRFQAVDADFRFPRWQNGGTELGSIRMNAATSLVEIYIGTSLEATGSITLSANTWYLIEVHVKINDSTGAVDVRIDGVDDASFSGDTKPGADTTVDVLHFQNSATGANANWLDDLALNDTAGGVDDSWCGDGKIIAVLPNDNGDVSQLVGSDADSVNNYLLVDEVPSDGDTTYVKSGTSTEYDLYNLADFTLPAGYSIGRVYVESRSREELAGGDSINLGIKPSGGAEDWSADIPQIVTYDRYVGTEYMVNPDDSAPWAEADIDALQIGVKVT